MPDPPFMELTMARSLLLRAGLLALSLLGPLAPLTAQSAPARPFACPPCGCTEDGKVFHAEGACPSCGMALQTSVRRVGVLVFDGVQIIDAMGPYEMFGAAGFEVVTVAASRKAVTTSMGLEVVPRFAFTDAPPVDVLVIPGGAVDKAMQDAPTLAYIKRAHAQTRTTLSVCNGVFILANTGLLDGLTATTTRGNIPKLARAFPKVKVVGERRYVDNGHIVTAAGLSAGIDGALHVIETIQGKAHAKGVAHAEEYAWGESN